MSCTAVLGDDINEAVSRAYQCVASKPAGLTPPELEVPVNLLRNGTRLAARVRDYRTACTYNPRPGELPMIRILERMDPQSPRTWSSWKTARWGAFRVAVRNLWQILEEDNPKLTELWRVLDHLDRETEGSILIRCHSRAASAATKASLATGNRTPAQEQLWGRIQERLILGTFKDRFPAGTFVAQVLTGAPPPWLFSLFLGIEAISTHVLMYDAEEAGLRRLGERWATAANGWQQAAARTLGALPERPVQSPLPLLADASQVRVAPSLEVPGLSLADVLDVAANVLDPAETDRTAAAATAAGSSMKTCIPVGLDDGRIWWCADEDGGSQPVLVVTAAGHEYRPTRELKRGDCVVVPAGEGTESIHARLVAASRGNDEVQSLDLILSQFRSAARAVLTGRTQRDAIERVRSAGAEAADQLAHWARGTTIAPRVPGDVEAVFRAAGRPCPDLRLIYAVAGALRNLHRMLGRFIAAISRGRGDEAVERLRDFVGDVADELLDEFVVATVTEIGPARQVSSSIAGRIR